MLRKKYEKVISLKIMSFIHIGLTILVLVFAYLLPSERLLLEAILVVHLLILTIDLTDKLLLILLKVIFRMKKWTLNFGRVAFLKRTVQSIFVMHIVSILLTKLALNNLKLNWLQSSTNSPIES